MEQKRVMLAVLISFVIIVLWSWLMPQPKAPVNNAEQANQTQEQKAPETASAPAKAPQSPDLAGQGGFNPSAGEIIEVNTPLYIAKFDTAGGVMVNFMLKKYKMTIDKDSQDVDLVGPDAISKAPMGLIVNGLPTWSKAQWSFSGENMNLGAEGTGSLVFTGKMDGMTIVRTLTFAGDSYLVNEDVTLVNHTSSQLVESVAFTAASRSLSAADNRYNPTRVSYYDTEGLTEVSDRDDLTETGVEKTGDISWGAIQSNYFLIAVLPGQNQSTMKGGYQDKVFRVAVSQSATIPAGQQSELRCTYFIGPCDRDILAKSPANLKESVNFGWFDFIAKPLLIALVWLYKYVHNYGLAIILLTIGIKILFWPLSHKSYKSMEQMKRLQPMMAKLREKYKDDKERMNQELMQLYKTYKVNPAGGCVPMLLQIPVFFGLYKALLGAIELRHAVFIEYLPFTHKLWLADLSAKDPFYITPIIMGITMFLQQRLSPQAGDPTQQKVMLLMPLVFTFLFLNFPSGLVVYWLVNNVLSIAQQWWMMRKVK